MNKPLAKIILRLVDLRNQIGAMPTKPDDAYLADLGLCGLGTDNRTYWYGY